MNDKRVYLYRDRHQELTVARADVLLDGFWLCGLQPEGGVPAACTALALPAPEETEALCACLENSALLWAVCSELLRRLPLYLKQQRPLSLYWGRAKVAIRGNAAARDLRLMFHRTESSRFSERQNLRCNVCFRDGYTLCGVRLDWCGEDELTVRFPTPDELRRADELLRDAKNVNAVCAAIRGAATPPAAPKKAARIREVNGKPTNRYGRVKDALASNLLKYTPGNVLRPSAFVKAISLGLPGFETPKRSPRECADALGSGYIDAKDIELLDALAEFRFLTASMLLDLFACGRIPCDKSYSADRLNRQLEKLTGYGLVTSCQFISFHETGVASPGRISIARIHVLDSQGGTLLRELGREAQPSAFDAYQDGAVVRECLCVNQWLLYWMTAYPEAISGRVVRNSIVYGLGAERSGAWLGAWLTVGGRVLAALPLRRCAEADRAAQEAEITEKAVRLGRLFEAPERTYSFSGDNYQALKLTQPPILCYICEDEAHMEETAALLSPLIPAWLTVWLSCDQRLFNYEFEGQRFRPLTAEGLGGWLDPGEALDLGEERKEEKRLDREEDELPDPDGADGDAEEDSL